MQRNSTNHKKHPYLKTFFYSDPDNQFWNNSRPVCTEGYRERMKSLVEEWEKQSKTLKP